MEDVVAGILESVCWRAKHGPEMTREQVEEVIQEQLTEHHGWRFREAIFDEAVAEWYACHPRGRVG